MDLEERREGRAGHRLELEDVARVLVDLGQAREDVEARGRVPGRLDEVPRYDGREPQGRRPLLDLGLGLCWSVIVLGCLSWGHDGEILSLQSRVCLVLEATIKLGRVVKADGFLSVLPFYVMSDGPRVSV